MAKQSKKKDLKAYLESEAQKSEKIVKSGDFDVRQIMSFFSEITGDYFEVEQLEFENNFQILLEFIADRPDLSFWIRNSLSDKVSQGIQIYFNQFSGSLPKASWIKPMREFNLFFYWETFQDESLIGKFNEKFGRRSPTTSIWYSSMKQNFFDFKFGYDVINGKVEELGELESWRRIFEYILEKNKQNLSYDLKNKIIRFLREEGIVLLLEKREIDAGLLEFYVEGEEETHQRAFAAEHFSVLFEMLEKEGIGLKTRLVESILGEENFSIDLYSIVRFFNLFPKHIYHSLDVLLEVLKEKGNRRIDEFANLVLTQRSELAASLNDNFTFVYASNAEVKNDLYMRMCKSLLKLPVEDGSFFNSIKNLVEFFGSDIYFLLKGERLERRERLRVQKLIGKYILNNQTSLYGQIKNCFVSSEGKEEIISTIDLIEKEAIENKDSEFVHKAWNFYKEFQKSKLDNRATNLLKELENGSEKGEFHKSYLSKEIIFLESDDGIKRLIDISVEWIYENKYPGVVDRIGEDVQKLSVVIPYLIKYFQTPQIIDGKKKNEIERRIEGEVKSSTGIEKSLKLIKESLSKKIGNLSKSRISSRGSLYKENGIVNSDTEEQKPKDEAKKQNSDSDQSRKNKTKSNPENYINLDHEIDKIKKWVFGLKSDSKIYLNLVAGQDKEEIKPAELVDLAEEIIELLIQSEKDERAVAVRKWTISILRGMSEPDYQVSLYEQKLFLLKEKEKGHESKIGNIDDKLVEVNKKIDGVKEIKKKLRLSVSQVISKELKREEDPEIVEHMVATIVKIGNLSSKDALTNTLLGSEKEKSERQNLLYDYYLQPAKRRSTQAANLLEDAVYNAKRTMLILQILNVMTFLIGATLLIGGIIVMIQNQEWGTRLTGILSSIGGLIAIVTIFIREPLKRIQIAIGDLVQIQTAFTGFIWGLNLNGTYIQSQYVAEGTLTEFDINQAVKRIDKAMDKTSYLIEHYTADNETDIPAYISQAIPQQGNMNTVITLLGHGLKGRRRDMNLRSKEAELKRYQIALNGQKIYGKTIIWRDDQIVFQLKPEYFDETDFQREDLRISVFIDDKETNGISFQLEELQMGDHALEGSLIARLSVLMNSKQGLRMPRRVRNEISKLISENPKKDDKGLPTLTAANKDTKSRNIDPESNNNLFGENNVT